MTPPTPSRLSAKRPIGLWLIQASASLAAAIWGYDFGDQVSGFWLGLIAGANGAVFAALLAGAAMQRVMSLFGRPPDRG